MKSLDQCRKEIDEINQSMLKLFEKRMAISKEVVLYKLAHDMEIFQPEREKLIIEATKDKIIHPDLKDYGTNFMQSIMNISKDYQADFLPDTLDIQISKPLDRNKDLKVGFQGVEGAFGQEALEVYFSTDVHISHFEQFEDVFKALDNDHIQYGVVPIENSSTGAINDVYDLIRNYGFYIVGEQSISISQHLLGIKGTSLDKVKEVYSHPQGLAQTTQFLDKYPHIKRIPYTNTAMAAKMVSEKKDHTQVAIASRKAARLYHLDILAENIHNDKTNHTRFIIIGKNMESIPEFNRISVLCSLKHEVGALVSILNTMKDYQLNMVRIESRPIKEKPWEYYFYIDFEGNIEDENVKKALKKMAYSTKMLRILGLYKQSLGEL